MFDKLSQFKEFRNQQRKIFTPKPWERFDPEFDSKKKLAVDYLILMWKMIASYTHIICYFFMLLAAISNGGIIYMVYPLMIFGYALMEENRPGKQFWYFVIIYT